MSPEAKQDFTPNLILKLALLGCASMTVMAGAILAPSLPQMAEVFRDVPNSGILTKMILTVPAIFIALLSPVAGLIADKFGRKQVLIVSLILYGIGGTSGLYLDDLYMILVGRGVLGLGVAGIMTISTTLVADYFEGDARNQFMGIQSATMSGGAVVYMTLGGFLADFSWREPFAIYFASLLLLPVVWKVIKEPTIKRSPEHEAEATKKVPYFTIGFLYILMFIIMLLFYLMPLQVPFLLKHITEVSNMEVGFALSFTMLTSGSVALLYPRVKKRLSHQAIYGVIFLFTATGFILLSYAHSYMTVILSMIVVGAGLGLSMPNATIWAMSMSPEQYRGRIIGGLTAFLFSGQFVSPILSEQLGTIVGLHASFGVAGIFMGVLAVGFGIYSLVGFRFKN